MLLLGVLQAQAAGQVAAGSFDLLETQVLTSSASSVSFTGLSTYAADYQHLQIRIAAHTDSVSNNSYMRLNGDSGNNYSWHQLVGTGSSVVSAAATSDSKIAIFYIGSNEVGAAVVDFLDAYETTKNKTIRTLQGNTSSTRVALASGAYLSTSAISSILIGANFSVGSQVFVTGSRFSLYGIRGG